MNKKFNVSTYRKTKSEIISIEADNEEEAINKFKDLLRENKVKFSSYDNYTYNVEELL